MPLKDPVGLAHNGLPIVPVEISKFPELPKLPWGALEMQHTVSQLALNSFSCAKKARTGARALADHRLLRIVVPTRWEGAGGSLAASPERGGGVARLLATVLAVRGLLWKWQCSRDLGDSGYIVHRWRPLARPPASS